MFSLADRLYNRSNSTFGGIGPGETNGLRNHKLEKKAIIFAIIDVALVFLFTWIWFKMKGQDSPLKHSVTYTIYISAVFMVYYYLYDLWWDKNGDLVSDKIDTIKGKYGLAVKY